jgi:putative ATP-dependent endonuclease of OLD family
VLIVEGHTEYDAFPAAARQLHKLHPDRYLTLEGLGIAVVNAESDSQVAALGEHFTRLGIVVFAVFDKQSPEAKAATDAAVTHSYEAPEKGFENVLLNGTAEPALRRFAAALVADDEWPRHLAAQKPTPATLLPALRDALREYFKWSKGAASGAALLCQCAEDEMPPYVVQTLSDIKAVVAPSAPAPMEETPAGEPPTTGTGA